MEQMKVGIIGAGRIAANMAKTLDGMDDAAAYAIAARNLDRAQKFAKEWGFEKAYGSYEELVNDPEVTMPEQITGFEYEVRASMKAIREGKLECMEMPHEESIRIMEQMDGLRKDWGIEYPFEKGNRPC